MPVSHWPRLRLIYYCDLGVARGSAKRFADGVSRARVGRGRDARGARRGSEWRAGGALSRATARSASSRCACAALGLPCADASGMLLHYGALLHPSEVFRREGEWSRASPRYTSSGRAQQFSVLCIRFIFELS